MVQPLSGGGYTRVNAIGRIYRDIFRWVPGPAIYSVGRRLYDGLVPVLITPITVAFFDSAARFLEGDNDASKLYLFAGLYLFVYLINDLLGFASSIIVQCWIYEKCTSLFRMALYEKFAKLPLIALESAETMNRKERVDKAINDEVLSSTFQRSQAIAQNAISVVGIAAVLAQYSLWLLPLSVLSVLPYLIARVVRGREFFYVKNAQAKKTRLRDYLWNLFTTRQTAKEMRVMGFDGYITEKWRETRDEVNEELWAVQKKDAVSLMWCDAARIAGYCASISFVLWLALRGDVTLGVFGAAIAAFFNLQYRARDFLSDIGRITEHLAHASDYYSFIDMPEEQDGNTAYPGLHESIRFENVSFSYPNSAASALKSVNLTVHKGEKIVVLGENGSGKTTLSKVLLGLYPAERGRVLYDGVPVEAFAKDSFYSNISAIAQDFVSYNLTLRENVAISDVSRMDSDAEIRAALADADAAEGIALDDAMGREFGGHELSGGQWQKLAIARGLFRRAELILLDEPTSALDPLIETEVLTRFIRAAEGKTALIISHRVGLCKLVDRIVVMQNGEIAEAGSHDELMRAGGAYKRLYEAQESWYKP